MERVQRKNVIGVALSRCKREFERLGKRVEELEGERRKAKHSRRMTESSSGSEEGGGKWRWDGENWWFKGSHRGPINSRLRREDFQDDWGDHRRDEETGRRAI